MDNKVCGDRTQVLPQPTTAPQKPAVSRRSQGARYVPLCAAEKWERYRA